MSQPHLSAPMSTSSAPPWNWSMRDGDDVASPPGRPMPSLRYVPTQTEQCNRYIAQHMVDVDTDCIEVLLIITLLAIQYTKFAKVAIPDMLVAKAQSTSKLSRQLQKPLSCPEGFAVLSSLLLILFRARSVVIMRCRGRDDSFRHRFRGWWR